MPSERLGAYRLDRAVLASGIVLVADCALRSLGPEPAAPWTTVLGWGLAVVGWLVLGLRSSYPVAVAAVSLVAAVGYYQITTADGPSPMIVFMVALYTVARAGRLVAVVALTSAVMVFVGYGEFIAVGDQRKIDNMAIALLSGWFLSVIAFGHAMRARAAYQAEAEQRALAAERERDARVRQAATEERLRIAREIHDVLGHTVSLMNIQAAAALHRSIKRPGRTEELTTALEFVRDTSREALRELRATLGVLRADDDLAPTAPTAGLEQLGELTERASATGLRVTVRVSGEPSALPPQISLAAYRIVQESLTNITRHAGATSARIEVAYGPGELRVRIDDDGRGSTPEASSGSGIAGMSERARAFGGELSAANTESGFRVSARLPLGPAPAPAGLRAPAPEAG
ncbi:sensor histidine kinase [Streptomyces sp. NPDC051815]|uniref:sensor histidine kinase n=1 Tax=Streptomyces sp. NPDC051815 TaxID=3365674 RepID=UPI00378B1351